jgi:hypothetical protein
MWTDDPLAEREAAKGPAFPEGTDTSVDRFWVITPGEADGVLYAGVAPAALFMSTDGGATWSLNEPLWKERIAGDWQPGFGGLALHSICPWPGEPERLAVGVSAAGVWLTEDGGVTWSTGYTGLVPRYLPEEARTGTNTLCVHNMHRAPTAPERLFMQFHGSVYRSDDAGSSWNEIAEGLPSGFGFPLAIDPADPDSAFVIPHGRRRPRDTRREGPRLRDARRWRLVDGARRRSARGDAWLTVLRQALGRDGEGSSSVSGSGLRAARCSEAPTPAGPGRPWPPSGTGDERPRVVVIGPKASSCNAAFRVRPGRYGCRHG